MSVLISMRFLTFCWRSIEEDDVLSQAHACEATIVYTGGCPPRAGRSRRVPLSGRKVETVAIRCPVQRTRISLRGREHIPRHLHRRGIQGLPGDSIDFFGGEVEGHGPQQCVVSSQGSRGLG